MNLQPPDPEEFPGTAFEFWEYRLDKALAELTPAKRKEIEALIAEVMTDIEAVRVPDFTAWFEKRHSMTLAEAWRLKRMRQVIADACDLWSTAQAVQRRQDGMEKVRVTITRAAP